MMQVQRRSSVNKIFGKYWAVFRTQMINQFAYPLDLISRSFMIVLFMWIFTQLWRTTYNAQGTSAIAGLSLQETIWYLMLAETIVLGRPMIATPISETVKDGSIAYLLGKPYHFLVYQYFHGLGNSLLQILANLILGSAVVWLLVGPPPPLSSFYLVLIAIFLAWTIDFCMYAVIGLMSFVTEDISAFLWIHSKFVLILGGVLIPLDFFPDWLQKFAKALPFAYSVYGPARLFIEPSFAQFTTLALFQLGWILVLGIILWLFYRRATGLLAINGG